MVAREERLEAQRAAAAQQSRQVAHVEQFIERFRYKATKARQVQSRVKSLQKLDRIVVDEHESPASRFGFPKPRRSSRIVAELEDVTAGYDGDNGDEIVLTDVTFTVERGGVLALVGPNGAGKTTLVKLLTGDLEPLSGRVSRGTNVDLSYFDQLQAEVLDEQRTVIDEFRTVPGVGTDGRNPRTYLASFGFRGDAVDRLVGDLSGGEQTRLALAKTLAVPVNLLILDEPTNHLDLPSCDVLEDALSAYPGTVVLITHDRHLIRSVADNLVEVRSGRAVWHTGVPDKVLYPAQVSSPPKAQAESGSSTQPKQNQGPRKQRSKDPASGLRKRLARAERDWEAAEAVVVAIQERLSDPDLYKNPEEAAAVVAEHEGAKDRAATLMSEWEKLSAQLGG